MNKHILFVIDHLANPDKYTQEQLKDNALDAAADAYRAYDAVAFAAKFATYDPALAAADYYFVDVEYWINEYFEESGENKDDYIKELNK